MTLRRRLIVLVLGLATIAGAGIAIAQLSKETGRIGPANRIQPSGRQLDPEGKLTKLGNLPVGGALTTNGRFYWTLSAGRGKNDIRIVEVVPKVNCAIRKGKAKRRSCVKRRAARVGRVIQTIEMPGVSGGIVMARDNRTVYVSGVSESNHKDQKVAADVPGKGGNTIHVFRYDGATGVAKRDGVIPVPPPSGAPIPQSFPPTNRELVSWPRDLALSPDGKTLLAALNLADRAAIVDIESKAVKYVEPGNYPYGAAITKDGKFGLVSSETEGTVAVIDLATARVTKRIQVGPHLSHPEGIAIDPKADRAYVAVTHSDQVAVLDTKEMRVERMLSVGRPEGIGTAPVDVTVSRDGGRLFVPLSGSDEVAVFALPGGGARRSSAAGRAAERVLQHEGRKGFEDAKIASVEVAEYNGEEAEERAEAAAKKRPAVPVPEDFSEIGRIPVGSYPTDVAVSDKAGKVVWLSAKGLGVGPNPNGPSPVSKDDSDDAQGNFQYLPTQVFGASGIMDFPSDKRLRQLTPKASKQVRPIAGQKPPEGTPIAPNGPIKHVFYIVRENRTYDQIFGAEPRGDGDPKLELFGEEITPNAHALAKRFPLLDHVYANSEASIDGHFWTSAASVSDYVVKNWHQNYGARKRPYDFGVYSVSWPSSGFLFDQAEKQGISWFNFGEAIAGTVPLADKDRNAEETQRVAGKFAKSDLGQNGCFPNDASSGGTDVVLGASGQRVEVYDSSIPAGAPPGSISRYDCFAGKFDQWVQNGSVPAFTYITYANDHTAGTKPGERTPRAMVAENDYALGQTVDKISKSPIWKNSLILVVEDDSQNGADHVDAHRIPAFAISPYAKQGAVIHTRYDFLSFIRTLQIPIGMKPLNLFDALATPMYDVFTKGADNADPYTAIPPKISLVERNTAKSPNAALSQRLNINIPDRVPQRILDKILWQSIHGADSEPPPPGPNSSPLDEPMARSIERGDFKGYDANNRLAK